MIALEFQDHALVSGAEKQFAIREKPDRIDDVVPRVPKFLGRAIGSDSIN
jgi:hypothetical protein